MRNGAACRTLGLLSGRVPSWGVRKLPRRSAGRCIARSETPRARFETGLCLRDAVDSSAGLKGLDGSPSLKRSAAGGAKLGTELLEERPNCIDRVEGCRLKVGNRNSGGPRGARCWLNRLWICLSLKWPAGSTGVEAGKYDKIVSKSSTVLRSRSRPW